jgi:hypothetical protein
VYERFRQIALKYLHHIAIQATPEHPEQWRIAAHVNGGSFGLIAHIFSRKFTDRFWQTNDVWRLSGIHLAFIVHSSAHLKFLQLFPY